ncbi:phosphatases II [Ramicandelaber brevisporus]|nr:phosphatases II [Ramicandelaber brevisporus]
MEKITVPKVDSIRLTERHTDESGASSVVTHIGTLHLTTHHLIFSSTTRPELWLQYPLIQSVEQRVAAGPDSPPALTIRCHHFMFLLFTFDNETVLREVIANLRRLMCIESVTRLYAYEYEPRPPYTFDGWNSVYDPQAEYRRQGVGGPVGTAGATWRISTINSDYKLCPTYPSIVAVPSRISDTVLYHASKYRSRQRLPILSYLHSTTGASITRCSQPLAGLSQNRSVQDEKIFEGIFATSGRNIAGYTGNIITDARPTANAMATTAMGAGTENMENYKFCRKVYLGIDNIHVMRSSLNKLMDVLSAHALSQPAPSTDSDGNSGWLKHLGNILDGTRTIVDALHNHGDHVVVHCSDGWDRTAQLTSTAMLCLDPYYRTMRGFAVLVEKEWVSTGHKFADRCGHLPSGKRFSTSYAAVGNSAANALNRIVQDNASVTESASSGASSNNSAASPEKEASPVFHQFLDCVYQLWTQHPTRFEFTEDFLIQLHQAVYSCQFGTFLFNCERERNVVARASEHTQSIWSHLLSDPAKYRNELFDLVADQEQDCGVIMPSSKHLRFWSALYRLREPDVAIDSPAPVSQPLPQTTSVPPSPSPLPVVAPVADSANVNLPPSLRAGTEFRISQALSPSSTNSDISFIDDPPAPESPVQSVATAPAQPRPEPVVASNEDNSSKSDKITDPLGNIEFTDPLGALSN